MLRATGILALAAIYPATRWPDVAPLAGFVCLTLFVSGPISMVRADEVTALTEGLPAFTVDSIPGVGHFIQEERPDVVVAAVARIRAP